jgi:rhodanese-related sulfurtransferase
MMRSAQDVPYEESESYMIVDDLADDDWMTSLLRSPIFRVLPPANLQKILMSLQEVRYKAGEIIINQGESGDYYYIIKKGRCLISRKPGPNAKEIRLGQLTDQDAFGEDALITGQPRNVSITALSDVALLRLGKEQFITLMKQPALKYVSFGDMQGLVAEGAQLLDVREPVEFNKFHLPRSNNVPFYSLRMHLKSLNRHQAVIVVCEDGKHSETAAFILLRQRFNALVLSGGMAGVQSAEFLHAPPVFSVEKVAETKILSEAIQAEPQAESVELPNLDESRRLREIIVKFKNHCRILESEKKALQQQCILLAKRIKALEAELKAGKNE